ncbi:MAG TPA: biotin--[acetyl-CoA-carboxylase] ligase [Hyphomicrobium sp.]|nr:biotin--[acetyl-CoA-carboxylase] ligase [Hyphomicrobium sp.]
MTSARIERLSAVDSTNAEAMRRAVAGECGPLWITTDAQTAGRGRAGRSWSSDPGNLQATLLVTLSAAPPKAYQLALVAGVAVFDAIDVAMRPDAPQGLRLKWPNDILVDGVKTGGILIESSTLPRKHAEEPGLAAVIGIGLNIASHPATLDRPATHLTAHGACPDPQALLAHISEAMGIWLAIWDEGRGFATVRDAWLNRAHPLGERMSINTGVERVSGTFLGLDHDGALIIETEGGTRQFTFGDVSLEGPLSANITDVPAR